MLAKISSLMTCACELVRAWTKTLAILKWNVWYKSALRCCYVINSLHPGRFELNFRWVIFKLILVIGGWGMTCEIAVRWLPLDLTDDKSTLVHVMSWCRQARCGVVHTNCQRKLKIASLQHPYRSWISPLNSLGNNDHTWTTIWQDMYLNLP